MYTGYYHVLQRFYNVQKSPTVLQTQLVVTYTISYHYLY